MKARADVVELLQAGHCDAEIHRRTGADVREVARTRKAGRFGPATITRRGTRPHPKDAQIRELLHAGLGNNDIARQLGVDRAAVRRIRADARVPLPLRQPMSLDAKWEANTQPLEGGHLEWTGSRAKKSGTPVLRSGDRMHTAAAVAFRRRTGRDPVGQVKAECGMRQCVAPDHVEDEPGRVRLREQLRHVMGMGARKPRCRRGHDQAEHGRYEPDGTAYCQACHGQEAGAP
ncbi:hypothetical protein [Streptomyces sp. NPDC050263]|uniref:hypothetical protein n=1 Tax=Streptomyces sp. NPDC050263 TaxID=3155037 RepID=UPI00343E40B6